MDLGIASWGCDKETTQKSRDELKSIVEEEVDQKASDSISSQTVSESDVYIESSKDAPFKGKLIVTSQVNGVFRFISKVSVTMSSTMVTAITADFKDRFDSISEQDRGFLVATSGAKDTQDFEQQISDSIKRGIQQSSTTNVSNVQFQKAKIVVKLGAPFEGDLVADANVAVNLFFSSSINKVLSVVSNNKLIRKLNRVYSQRSTDKTSPATTWGLIIFIVVGGYFAYRYITRNSGSGAAPVYAQQQQQQQQRIAYAPAPQSYAPYYGSAAPQPYYGYAPAPVVQQPYSPPPQQRPQQPYPAPAAAPRSTAPTAAAGYPATPAYLTPAAAPGYPAAAPERVASAGYPTPSVAAAPGYPPGASEYSE